jgi:hypothetical protein
MLTPDGLATDCRAKLLYMAQIRESNAILANITAGGVSWHPSMYEDHSCQ